MRRTCSVAILVGLFGGANSQQTCGNFNAGDCTDAGSPGLLTDNADTVCGCDVGTIGCDATAVSVCCQTPTCDSADFNDNLCTGLWEAGGADKAGSECGWDGCAVEECCKPNSAPAVDCDGYYQACDASNCDAGSSFVATVSPDNGGRACPTDTKTCFDAPATAATCVGGTDCALNAAGTGCDGTGCTFQAAYDGTCEDTCDASLCTAGTKLAAWATAPACTGADGTSYAADGTTECGDSTTEATCEGVDGCTWESPPDCNGPCTLSDCCVQNECEVPAGTWDDPGKTLSTDGYYASKPDGGNVRNLGVLGCATGVYASDDDGSSTGGYLGMPYNVDVTCPVDKFDTGTAGAGVFVWEGCTRATDCNGAANRVAMDAKCEAINDSETEDVTNCDGVQDLTDATDCEAVIATASSATCENPASWTPSTTCPAENCVLGSGGTEADCPAGCVYTPASDPACVYTPAVKSDFLDLNNLPDNVMDTEGDASCRRLDPDGILAHMETCEVMCADGWHLVESKRDENKIRIQNPKYWRPLQPVCDNGILHFSVSCAEDTDWTGVLIIVLVLGFFLILIPVVKYLNVVGKYNKDKAAGCTWAPDGTKNDPTGADDSAAD